MSEEMENGITLETWLKKIESKVKKEILDSRNYESYFLNLLYFRIQTLSLARHLGLIPESRPDCFPLQVYPKQTLQ